MRDFYGAPTKERLDFMFERQQRAVGTGRFASIAVVDLRAGKEMKAEARQRAKEISEHYAKQMLCSVVASIQLLSRASKTDITVAATVDDGVRIAHKAAAAEAVAFDAPAVRAALARLVVDAPRARTG